MGAHEILFAQVRWEPTKAYARRPQAPQAGPISGLLPPVLLSYGRLGGSHVKATIAPMHSLKAANGWGCIKDCLLFSRLIARAGHQSSRTDPRWVAK